MQVGDVNVCSMDSTQIAGVIRNPAIRMQYVKFVVARVFHVYEETDEKYVPLTYTPCLILTSAIKHNRAMSRINYIPINNLSERIQFQLKHMDEQDILNEAAAAAATASTSEALVEKNVNESSPKIATSNLQETSVAVVTKPSPNYPSPLCPPPAIVIEEV